MKVKEQEQITISIIIPCHDEDQFIQKCLDSIIGNDFPKDCIEVLVIDGMSSDGTREIVKRYSEHYSFIKLIDNIKMITPIAINIGIQASTGSHIMILSSHSKLTPSFIKSNIDNFNKSAADCIGGQLITMPAKKTLTAQSIALALSHPFGVGNAYFRIGSKEPRYVDTVPFGCYKRAVFEKIGLFDDNLIRNQDLEFNLRLKRAGGKILLIPDLVSYYHARSNFKDLFKQNFWNGFWVIYGSKFAKVPFSIRHLVPFFFVTSVLGSLLLSVPYNPLIYLLMVVMGLYLIINLFVSLRLSFKHSLKYLPFLIVSFFTLHFSYGIGSLWGLIRLPLIPLKISTNQNKFNA